MGTVHPLDKSSENIDKNNPVIQEQKTNYKEELFKRINQIFFKEKNLASSQTKNKSTKTSFIKPSISSTQGTTVLETKPKEVSALLHEGEGLSKVKQFFSPNKKHNTFFKEEKPQHHIDIKDYDNPIKYLNDLKAELEFYRIKFTEQVEDLITLIDSHIETLKDEKEFLNEYDLLRSFAINDAKIEAKQLLLQKIKPITIEVTALHAAAIAQNFIPIKLIGIGKAKHVWLKLSDQHFAYITAVRSKFSAIFYRKEAEIKEEVETANKIIHHLYTSSLQKFINAEFKNESEQKKQAIFNFLKDNFKDSEELKELRDGHRDLVTLQQNLPTRAHRIIDGLKKKEYQSLFNAGENLATQFIPVTAEEEKILGRVTWKTPVSSGALDKILPTASFDQAISFSKQLLTGLRDLHEAGYVHGDLKLDNLLTYGSKLKIADFGKTRPIGNKDQTLHTGNNRVGLAVEGKLSKAGEVQSAGFLIIQMLEAKLLAENEYDDGLIVKPEQIDTDQVKLQGKLDEKQRRGIERFLVTNKLLPHKETFSLKGKISLIGRAVRPNKYPDAQSEIYKYIGQKNDEGTYTGLLGELKKAQGIEDGKLNQLGELLKSLTQSDPSKRPSLDDAIRDFEKIGL